MYFQKKKNSCKFKEFMINKLKYIKMGGIIECVMGTYNTCNGTI